MFEQDGEIDAPIDSPSSKENKITTSEIKPALFTIACAGFLLDWVLNRLLFIPLSDHLSNEASIFWLSVGAFPRNLGAISTLLLLLLLFWDWFRSKHDLRFRQKIILAALSGVFIPAMVIPTFFPQVMTSRYLILYCLGTTHALVIFLIHAAIRTNSNQTSTGRTNSNQTSTGRTNSNQTSASRTNSTQPSKASFFRRAGSFVLLSSLLATISMLLINLSQNGLSQSGWTASTWYFQAALWARHSGEFFYLLFPLAVSGVLFYKGFFSHRFHSSRIEKVRPQNIARSMLDTSSLVSTGVISDPKTLKPLSQSPSSAKMAAFLMTFVFVLLMGLFLLVVDSLGPDLRIWLYKAFRVVTFLDAAPLAYGVIINLAIALSAPLLVLGNQQDKRLAAVALLFLAAGFSPKNPGQALTLMLAANWFCFETFSQRFHSSRIEKVRPQNDARSI